MRGHRVQRCVWAGLLAIVAGCGQSRTVPVEGHVVWSDGSPAVDLTGYFVESGVPGSSMASRGDIEPDGRFFLSTFESKDGAEPGSHKVAIAPLPRTEIDPPPKVKLPARYAKADTSGLTITVERGKPNVVTLTISRK